MVAHSSGATTKQACRDESVVYLFLPPQTYTSLYINVLSTVLRVSTFYTLYIYIYIYIYMLSGSFNQKHLNLKSHIHRPKRKLKPIRS